MSVTIDPPALTWLRGNVSPGATESDLTATYAFSHRLNGFRNGDCRLAEDGAHWSVTFYTLDETANVLECDLMRSIVAEADLWGSDGQGIVARNEYFFVKKEYRRQGFAKALYGAEFQLYARWGVREIQLMAADDGAVVWVRKFGFEPEEPGALLLGYRRWAADNGKEVDESANVDTLPDEFLRIYPFAVYKVIS